MRFTLSKWKQCSFQDFVVWFYVFMFLWSLDIMMWELFGAWFFFFFLFWLAWFVVITFMLKLYFFHSLSTLSLLIFALFLDSLYISLFWSFYFYLQNTSCVFCFEEEKQNIGYQTCLMFLKIWQTTFFFFLHKNKSLFVFYRLLVHVFLEKWLMFLKIKLLTILINKRSKGIKIKELSSYS